MLTNSCPTCMSAQPPGGQGRLCSMSHIPERSGLPSAVRGAGALRSGRPSDVLGTPAVGYFSHCAETPSYTTRTPARDDPEAAGRVGPSCAVLARCRRRHLLLDPRADHIEDLSTVVLQHHEVAVTEDAEFFELKILGFASILLQCGHERRPLRPPGLLRGDVHDWNASELLRVGWAAAPFDTHDRLHESGPLVCDEPAERAAGRVRL